MLKNEIILSKNKNKELLNEIEILKTNNHDLKDHLEKEIHK